MLQILVLFIALSCVLQAENEFPNPDEIIEYDKPPLILYKHKPDFPDSVIYNNPVKVWVRLLVDSVGTIRDQFIIYESYTGAGFGASAIDASRKCIIIPAYKNNKPIASWCTLKFEFDPEKDFDSDSAFKRFGYSLYNPNYIYDSLMIIDTSALRSMQCNNDRLPRWPLYSGSHYYYESRRWDSENCPNVKFNTFTWHSTRARYIYQMNECDSVPYPKSAYESAVGGAIALMAAFNRMGQIVQVQPNRFYLKDDKRMLLSAAMEAAMQYKLELDPDSVQPTIIKKIIQTPLAEAGWIGITIPFQLSEDMIFDLNKHFIMHTNIINKLNLDSLNSECAGQFKNLPEFGDTVQYDKLPEFILNVKPEYPPMAFRAGVTGSLWLALLVNEDGDVCRVKILKESGVNAGFEQSAIDAALQYKFKPAKKNSKPVAMWIVHKVKFQFTEEEKEQRRKYWRERLGP